MSRARTVNRGLHSIVSGSCSRSGSSGAVSGSSLEVLLSTDDPGSTQHKSAPSGVAYIQLSVSQPGNPVAGCSRQITCLGPGITGSPRLQTSLGCSLALLSCVMAKVASRIVNLEVAAVHHVAVTRYLVLIGRCLVTVSSRLVAVRAGLIAVGECLVAACKGMLVFKGPSRAVEIVPAAVIVGSNRGTHRIAG